MRNEFDDDFASFKEDYFSRFKTREFDEFGATFAASQNDLIAALYRHSRFGHVEEKFADLLNQVPGGNSANPSDYEPAFATMVQNRAWYEFGWHVEAVGRAFHGAFGELPPLNDPSAEPV